MDELGKLFIVGLPAPELSADDIRFLSDVRPSGVCLFSRNIKDPKQVREFTDGIREILGHRALICIDQEGGRVDRLRKIFEPMPYAEQLQTVSLADKVAEITAKALRLLGVNVNFAPVVDVARPHLNESGNGLGTRMFSTEPAKVIEIAGAYLKTLQANGISGCLKHFPGLGASEIDSHENLPTIRLANEPFEAVDLLPFHELIKEQSVLMVMVAHASYPSLRFNGPDCDLPSSLNPRVYGLLRDVIGFRGLTLTDDLEMGAILKRRSIEQASLDALSAGADIALICNARDGVYRSIELCWNEWSAATLQEKVQRTRTCLDQLFMVIEPPVVIDDTQWEHLRRQMVDCKIAMT